MITEIIYSKDGKTFQDILTQLFKLHLERIAAGQKKENPNERI